jgi:hypothetical protein
VLSHLGGQKKSAKVGHPDKPIPQDNLFAGLSFSKVGCGMCRAFNASRIISPPGAGTPWRSYDAALEAVAPPLALCDHPYIMLPRGWDRCTIVLLTFAALFVIAANLGQAQVFDLQRERVQMAELHGFWRFHTGDDLAWANPAFDDTGWPMLRSDQDWSRQGYKGYSGFAWYRFKVLLPQTHGPIALYIPDLRTSYEVFANGQPIGFRAPRRSRARRPHARLSLHGSA